MSYTLRDSNQEPCTHVVAQTRNIPDHEADLEMEEEDMVLPWTLINPNMNPACMRCRRRATTRTR